MTAKDNRLFVEAVIYRYRVQQRRTDHKNSRNVRCPWQSNRLLSHASTEAHDLQGADALLPALLVDIQALLADNAYDARNRVLDILEKSGVQAVIPPKRNHIILRKYDEDMYKIRHLIENFFAKLKQVAVACGETFMTNA